MKNKNWNVTYNMANMDLCSSCIYNGAGTSNGFTPECCGCKKREKIEESLDSKRSELEPEPLSPDFYFEQSPDFPTKTRALRRTSRSTKIQKANTLLPIITSKYEKLPQLASRECFHKNYRKCHNAKKQAKRNHQITLKCPIPGSILEKINAKNIHTLKTFLSTNSSSPELIEKTINILDLAKLCEGEIVAIFKEADFLNITFGFYSKTKLSKFKMLKD